HLVTHADGTPYERDGEVFLTWTCAGLGGFRQAHWGVFALDPAAPAEMRQVAHVISRRDGLLYGDHAGQLVRDGDDWLVAVSTWGDFSHARGVHVRHARTDADLLSGVHVIDTERTALPTELSTWDPALLREDGGWLVAYVESPSVKPFRFRPALARTAADEPWSGLRAAGSVAGLDQCEGPILVRRDGVTWLLASDGRGRRFPVFEVPVFDGQLAPAGEVSAPYPTNIPHPQLLRRDSDSGGSWLMLTFDGTRNEPRRRETGRRPVMGYGGHGDVVVMTAREGER
ncbi:MAG: hypothetical protein JWO46_2052, partial [Nocardioidaceae bacterium]|nr:hypothetical protein [Nocardioidaceae bacterium]